MQSLYIMLLYFNIYECNALWESFWYIFIIKSLLNLHRI